MCHFKKSMKTIFTIILIIHSIFLYSQEIEFPSKNDLHSQSLKELRILRNKFYAKKGYKFKSEFLKNYFNQFEWYQGTKTENEIEFSDLEKNKIELIKKIEKGKKLNKTRIKTLEILSKIPVNSMGSWDWSVEDRVKYLKDCKSVGYLLNDNSGTFQKRFHTDTHLFVQVVDGFWEMKIITINKNKYFIILNDIVGDGNNISFYLLESDSILLIDKNIFPKNLEKQFKKNKSCEIDRSFYTFSFDINDEKIFIENIYESKCLKKNVIVLKFNKDKIVYELIE